MLFNLQLLGSVVIEKEGLGGGDDSSRKVEANTRQRIQRVECTRTYFDSNTACVIEYLTKHTSIDIYAVINSFKEGSL